MEKELVAHASITVNAPIEKVWDALTKPEMIKQYMFGTNVESDWQVGSSIIWKGEWEGKSYEDKGKITKMEENRLLQYTYLSSFSDKPDVPESYNTITIELSSEGGGTIVSLSQDNNKDDAAREHSKKNWMMTLEGLKKLLEG